MTTPAAGTAPAPAARPWLARLPPGLFAIALGLLGLAGAWQRLDPSVGGYAQVVAQALLVTGLAVLAILTVLWTAKLVLHPQVVRGEWMHPVQGPLLALFPVTAEVAIILLAPRFPAWGGIALGLCARAAPAPGGDRVGGRRAPVDGADARRTALAGALPPDRARWVSSAR